MNDDIDTINRTDKSIFISDIPRQKPTSVIFKLIFECCESGFTLVKNTNDIWISLEKTAG